MYTPSVFKNENLEDVKKFIFDNSFGILLNQVQGRITGTHIPLEIDIDENANDILFGHLSKANPQSLNLNDGDEVLAIFNGPHAYISSSWYQKENAPTWNYIAVHVYGRIKILDNKTLMICLNKLVNKHEKFSEKPISLDDMSEETLNQVQGVLGFYIEITEIQATYKLSQNRNKTDYQNIIFKLNKSGKEQSILIADYMKNISIPIKGLF